MADNKYDFSAFDNHPSNYDFSAFDNHTQTELPGKLESLLRGGAQGATLGFSDELTGAAEALPTVLKTLTGGASLEDIKNEYFKNRDEARKLNELAQKTNPGTYFTGELGGGIVPAILTSGLGAAGEAATGSEAILNAAKLGGKYGAVAGLGHSESDNLPGMAKDIATGAGTGAITGGLIEGGIQGIKGLGRLAAKTDMGETLSGAAKMGYEGDNLLTKAGRQAVKAEKFETGKDITNLLSEVRTDQGQHIADLIANKEGTADASQINDKVVDLISNLSDDNPDKNTLLNIIQDVIQGKKTKLKVPVYEVTPEQTVEHAAVPSAREKLLEKMNKLQAAREFYPGENTPAVNDLKAPLGESPLEIASVPGEGKNYIGINDKTSGKLIGGLQEDIPGTPAFKEVIPEGLKEAGIQSVETRAGGSSELTPQELYDLKLKFQEMANDMGISDRARSIAKQATKTVGEFLEQNVPGLEEANDKFAFLDKAMKALNIKPKKNIISDEQVDNLSNIIGRLKSTTEAGGKASNRFQRGMDYLNQSFPEIAEEVQNKALETASRNEIARKAGNDINLMSGSLMGAVKSVSTEAANVAGFAARGLTKLTTDQLRNIASNLSTKGELGQVVGNILNNAADKDEIGRNAVIFTLMQNPTYREMIQKHLTQ